MPGLKLLAMKPTPLEKFQYLTHLRAANVHLFYRLLAENIKVVEELCYHGLPILTSRTSGIDTPHLHTHRRRGMPKVVRDIHAA